MKMQLQTALRLRCTVCDRSIDFEQRDEDMVDAALFGVKDPYWVCPGCLQTVKSYELHDDPEYQRRVRVKLFERFGRVVRVPSVTP